MRLLPKVKSKSEWERDLLLIQEQLEKAGFDAAGVRVLSPEEAREMRKALGFAGRSRRAMLPELSPEQVRHEQARAIILRGHEERAKAAWAKGPTDWRARP